MKTIDALIVEYTHRPRGGSGHQPEYRQLELYSKKRRLKFEEAVDDRPEEVTRLLSALQTGALLDAWFDARDPSREGRTSWERYLGLPRATGADKLIAELARLLRVVRLAAVHPDGRAEPVEGIMRLDCTFNRCALSLHITPVGLELLDAAVIYYLEAHRQPYSDAYVDAMLAQYFADLVGEIKRFSDEDRVLYQFRPRQPFNRHFRFDCDNPKMHLDDHSLTIEIGAFHADSSRYPIDFFLAVDDVLHIVPVEVLRDGRIALEDLAQWRARLATGAPLPARFRGRFYREATVVGLPMT